MDDYGSLSSTTIHGTKPDHVRSRNARKNRHYRHHGDDSREMTLKDRQDEMNKRHPFGLPVWKPALYKKTRSVVWKAISDMNASPSLSPDLCLSPGNVLWAILFGWWLRVVCVFLSFLLFCVPPNGRQYSQLLRQLARYLFWPFGRYVEHHGLAQDDCDATHDEEAGLFASPPRPQSRGGRHGLAQIVYDAVFVVVIAPLMLTVSALCWFGVFTVPMAKVSYLLLRHLWQHPLELQFKPYPTSLLAPGHHPHQPSPPVVLLYTNQAIALRYYKYTYDGINIIFINLLSLVFFVILDQYLLQPLWPESVVTMPATIFVLALVSVIPLSYLIGMGISSVSAQSSMGIGAFLNASFGSMIEIILYAVALMSGKSDIVEGALIGSVMASVLLLPGCSMVSGGIKRKEQRFNAKSAEVTSTMLIMAIIGALAPTLFYQMFGAFRLHCLDCPGQSGDTGVVCHRCYYDQLEPTRDPVFQNNVKPFMWVCAAILPSAYVIGIVFSLHTHVDMVWKKPASKEQRHGDGLSPREHRPFLATTTRATLPIHSMRVRESEDEAQEVTGHDSPTWNNRKSFTILFGCTLLYSVIAEVLIKTVDDVMKGTAVDQKFLGLTLFALVPNITEFMNAISFALNGNVVLSMEIGSAYALQVCLLQIPAMVIFSLWYNWGKEALPSHTFSLVFPRWDVISVMFSVFLLTYTYQEGKTNYFKGSILILSYLVLLAGFYFTPAFQESNPGGPIQAHEIDDSALHLL